MKYYFSLQLRLITRLIKANGINPLFAFSIILTGFLILSQYLFNQTEYASFIYLVTPIFFWSKLSTPNRISFLQTTFNKKDFRKIRMLENSISAIPFIAFLIYKQHFLEGLLLLVLAILFSFTKLKKRATYTIPTPFFKYPFEFTSGFRKTYPFIILAYTLTIIGISVNNFNLSMFGLILLILCCVSFYTMPEKKFFVWIFSLSPQKYLFNKIKTATWYTCLLSVPITIGILFFFPQNILITLAFQGIGILVVIVSLLGKYAVFPSEFNLSQGLAIAFSIFFPPLILLIIPIFYLQSVKRLKPILE